MGKISVTGGSFGVSEIFLKMPKYVSEGKIR
jgi:hypothetical protein